MKDKVIKKVSTKTLKSLAQYGFPMFKVEAVEFENGKIEGKVIWMKKISQNNFNGKYVTHKQLGSILDEKLSSYVTTKVFNERLDKLEMKMDKKIDNLEVKMDNKISSLEEKMNHGFNELKDLIIART